MAVAIEVKDISKQFRLYNEKHTSLKERVIHGGKMPFTPFWALRDVNVDINQGETFGILGRNGCGKSTLLKCVAGILKPTSGEIRVRGSLAAMLELGAGFQPDLSGRDNIYLNGSLLGLSRCRDRQAVRRHRRLRRARGLHRQPGEVLLVGHVRPPGLRRGRQRRARRAAGRRGAGRRATPPSSASASTT